MSADGCPRSWETEAAHDGRLDPVELQSHVLHLAQCTDCARERRALDRFLEALRAPTAGDAFMTRRLRRSVLTSMRRQRFTPDTRRTATHRGLLMTAALAATALVSVLWLQSSRAVPRASSVLHVAPELGAVFMHEQRNGLDYLDLRDGTLTIDFDRGTSGGLVVRVPDGEIRDLGTVFRVVVANRQTQEISVHEGAVVFRRRRAHDVKIAAGQVFLRSAGDETTSPADDVLGTAPEPASVREQLDTPTAHQRDSARSAATRSAHHREQTANEHQDVTYLRILALLQEQRRAEARIAAQEYLSRFPAGFRRAEVARIAAPDAP